MKTAAEPLPCVSIAPALALLPGHQPNQKPKQARWFANDRSAL